MNFVVGFLLAVAVAIAARLSRSLSRSGVFAAVTLGTVVYGFGGWPAAALVITFFVTSSLAGRLAARRPALSAPGYAKGAERDAGQVIGNGLIPALLSIVMATIPSASWALSGIAGAIAAVTADTWATELGALSRPMPRLITHLGKRVAPGTSGGVTTVGTMTAAAAAAFIGWVSVLLMPADGQGLIVVVAIAGLLGAIADSVLGATLQGIYVCTADHAETEQHPVHRCGAPTVHSRGWKWLNNDIVNMACSAVGAAAAIGLGRAFGSA